MLGTHVPTRQQVVSRAIGMIDAFRPDIARILRTTPIEWGILDDECGGIYDSREKKITLNARYPYREDVDHLAHTLIHEGVHALEDRQGTLPTRPRLHSIAFRLGAHEAVRMKAMSEVRAYRVASQFWGHLYPYEKIPERHQFDKHNNACLRALRDGSHDRSVAQSYMKYWGMGA